MAQGTFGSRRPDRFYRGSSKEPPWNQDIHTRALNADEQKYLMSIAGGEHASQRILRKQVGPVPHMDMASERSYRSRGSISSKLPHVVDELRGFNSSLKGELNSLKAYLHETNARLEQLSTARSSRRTARSRSSCGSHHPLNSELGRELYSRSTARSAARSASCTPASAVVADARQKLLAAPQHETQLPSARIRGYKIGHEVAMTTHTNGFTFPVFGPGSVTEDIDKRHDNMLKQAKANPVVLDASTSDTQILNNMYMEDPSHQSNSWQSMFRHQNQTFTNSHKSNLADVPTVAPR